MWARQLFSNLLDNPDFRNRFINALADHMNTTFQPHHVETLALEMHEFIQPYLDEHVHRWPQTANTSPNSIVDFAYRRPPVVREHFAERFDLTEPITMTFQISEPDRGRLQINTITIDSKTPGLPDPAAPYPWQGQYYPTVPIEVTAIANPGYSFSGWLEYPEHTAATIEVLPTADATLTAIFVPKTLLHYWHFNEPEQLLATAPNHEIQAQDGALHIVPGPQSEITDGSGQDFDGKNARLEKEAGSHLRINNPLGASVHFHAPTTGKRDIIVRYETRRSGQGAGIQDIWYTLDGIRYLPFQSVRVYNAPPVLHTLDFSHIPAANDNPDFGIRVTFIQGEGGLAGNNRFDNVTVAGVDLEFFAGVPPEQP